VKIVMIALVALAAGLVGGTTFAVLRAPKPLAHASMPVLTGRAAPQQAPAAPPVTSPDTAATRASAVRSPAVTAAAPPPAAEPASPAAPIPTMTASHVAPVQVTPLPIAMPIASPDTAHAEGYQQLGRIFGKMQTADAVKIMAYLGDEDVSRVLGTLNVRQAAALLAALPSERAARLSRRMIDHVPVPAAQVTR
jgi:hypothetical protein